MPIARHTGPGFLLLCVVSPLKATPATVGRIVHISVNNEMMA